MADIQRGRTGWKKEEDTLLFAEIEKSVGRGTPLKSVFEAVAEQTGRKPNSVRNYYYARIKEKDLSTTALHAGAFVPFSEEEIHSLLRTVLSAQANGISVRCCTMSMGGGDNRAMLRYQNKYRALLKNRPALVRQVAEELKAEGRSIVLISEELPELIGMSDRILLLKDGGISGEFFRRDGLTEAKLIEKMI